MAIVAYIKAIASFLIFYAFVELILPSTSFKKYIRVVLGLMTIVIVLKPIMIVFAESPEAVVESMFSIEQDLDKKILDNEKKNYDAITAQAVMIEYKQGLRKQMADMLLANLNIILVSDNIIVNEDNTSSEFGNIIEIKLYVSEPMEQKIKVDPIHVSTDTGNEDITQIQAEKIEGAKKIISDFYNLSQDNIHIILVSE